MRLVEGVFLGGQAGDVKGDMKMLNSFIFGRLKLDKNYNGSSG